MDTAKFIFEILDACGVTGLIVYLLGVFIDKIKKRSSKYKALQGKEQREMLENAIAKGLEPVNNSLKAQGEQINKLTIGTVSSLRNEILDHYYSCQRKGYRNDYDCMDIRRMYEAYKDLGGNSFIDEVVNVRFEELPTKDEYFRNKREEEGGAKKNDTGNK